MPPSPLPALSPLHRYAIDALVQETQRPIEEVTQLYVDELTRLQAGARVEDYLVLLTSKHVRESLRRGKSPSFLEPSAFNPLPDRELA